jgi:hypothetical protein
VKDPVTKLKTGRVKVLVENLEGREKTDQHSYHLDFIVITYAEKAVCYMCDNKKTGSYPPVS